MYKTEKVGPDIVARKARIAAPMIESLTSNLQRLVIFKVFYERAI